MSDKAHFHQYGFVNKHNVCCHWTQDDSTGTPTSIAQQKSNCLVCCVVVWNNGPLFFLGQNNVVTTDTSALCRQAVRLVQCRLFIIVTLNQATFLYDNAGIHAQKCRSLVRCPLQEINLNVYY